MFSRFSKLWNRFAKTVVGGGNSTTIPFPPSRDNIWPGHGSIRNPDHVETIWFHFSSKINIFSKFAYGRKEKLKAVFCKSKFLYHFLYKLKIVVGGRVGQLLHGIYCIYYILSQKFWSDKWGHCWSVNSVYRLDSNLIINSSSESIHKCHWRYFCQTMHCIKKLLLSSRLHDYI